MNYLADNKHDIKFHLFDSQLSFISFSYVNYFNTMQKHLVFENLFFIWYVYCFTAMFFAIYGMF